MTQTAGQTARQSLSALSDAFPGNQRPWLDRGVVTLPGGDVVAAHWHAYGYVIVPGLIPEPVIDIYTDAWEQAHGPFDPTNAKGWLHATPYMDCPELRALCCYEPLQRVLAHLIGEPMGVHLNLTGWVSTQRNWHQDGYLNPDTTRDFYAAVWIALDDIDPDAGPFEYVPGSHRLPTIRQDRMLRAMGEPPGGLDSDWPKRSEQILTPLFEDLIYSEFGGKTRRFMAHKGDVLVWHARLIHRGSQPVNPSRCRKALIAHYSGIHHRPDMPTAVVQGDGWYFPLESTTLV